MTATPNPDFDLIVCGHGPGSSAAVEQALALGLRTAWVSPAGPEAGRATVLRERAALAGPGRIRLESGESLAAPAIILTARGVPVPLAGTEPDGQRIFAAEDNGRVPTGPASLLVAGAGLAGVATALRAAARGTGVDLVGRDERILADQDPECVALITAALVAAGVRIHLGARLRDVSNSPDGVGAQLSRRGEAVRRPLAAEALCLATGRRPLTANLGLETVDVVQDRRGFLQVDSTMQTPQDGLYAIGDLAPTPSQAQVAASEARVAVAHAAGGDPAPVRYSRIPTLMPTAPGLAAVGLTAQAAAAAGHLVTVTDADPDSATPGLARAVRDDETGRTLGLHLVGPGASERLVRLARQHDFPLDLGGELPPAPAPEGQV